MTTDTPHSPRRPHPIREVVVLSLACLSYSLLSYLAPGTKNAALAHAHDIARFEARVGLFMEPGVNRWLSAHPILAQLASIQYAATFFLMTGAAMLILWIKAPAYYSRARWTLVVMTLGALVTYWTYPLAPPRLVDDFGVVDAVAHHTSSYSQLFGTLANPYGAMPSMHTGWALWVAFMLGTYVWRSWWARLLLSIHPILTVVTIIATGNHYIVDAAAAFVYFLLAWLFVTRAFNTLPSKVRTFRKTS